MGWVNGETCLCECTALRVHTPPTPNLELTLYAVCLNALQVCEPADAFWKLAVPSKSQWWVGFAVELLGHIAFLWKGPPVSASPQCCTHLEFLICACQRKKFSTESRCCEENLQDKPWFPVKLNLTYMTQRLLHPVFLVTNNNLHLLACSYASFKCNFAI